jgi:hypothetical protein
MFDFVVIKDKEETNEPELVYIINEPEVVDIIKDPEVVDIFNEPEVVDIIKDPEVVDIFISFNYRQHATSIELAVHLSTSLYREIFSKPSFW